jgi:hypothetical protein
MAPMSEKKSYDYYKFTGLSHGYSAGYASKRDLGNGSAGKISFQKYFIDIYI